MVAEAREGTSPSVETVYTPDDLPGLGAKINYLHTQGTVGLDWRTSPGYTRRGGYLGGHGARLRRSATRTSASRSSRYEAIAAHPDPARSVGALVPRPRPDRVRQGRSADSVLHAARAWRRLLAARLSSWRFRDQNSLLLQAEWRIMVNRYLDTGVLLRCRQGRGADVGSRLRQPPR